MGGLGNQMFQYAFGLQLATKRGQTLTVNDFLLKNRLLARLRNYTHRSFALAIFGIDPPSTSPMNLIRALLPFVSGIRLLRETDDRQAAVLPTEEQIVCIGYWQSEDFFAEARVAVRQCFVFRHPLNAFSSNLADRIRATPDSVFIHVRRGDYLTNTAANAYHGICGRDYYERAVAYMRQMLSQPLFYIFSDDLTWAKQELAPLVGSAVYADGNPDKDSWQDMYLMSQCQHAIIANSSFSWWGAWLITQPDKVIIAPRQWLNRDLPATGRQSPTPDGWIKL